MSMLWAFERLLWTPEQIEVAAREQRVEVEGEDEDAAAPPTQRCRVCAYEGPERPFCPHCLADTMVAIPPPRARLR